MSQRYLGGVITANPTTPTLASLSGVWTLEQQFQNFNVWSPEIVGNSVRLRSSASAYFNRTPGSAGSRQKWTYSKWIKRGTVGVQQVLLSSTNSSNDAISFTSGDNIQIQFANQTAANIISTAVYRDPSAWYHVLVSVDTTQATASNRVQLFVNGQQVTAFGTASYPSQNYSTWIDGAFVHNIGQVASVQYFDGYLTEINFIDGQALTPSSFGAFDSTGVWQPLPYTGTYGTNGFYLTFADNSAATAAALGKDTSGNGNNWTPNNVSLTAGVTYDWMLDSPTNWIGAAGGNGRGNYAVLNPLDKNAGTTPSNANLTWTASTPWRSARATFGMTSGKWYWEVTASGANNMYGIGTATASLADNNYPGRDANGWGYFDSNGNKFTNGSGSSYGASYTTNDVIGVAFDADNGTLTFYKNGTSQGTAFTGLTSGPYFPMVGNEGSTSNSNFGQRPFTYTPPTGFKALNTLNLPTPTIMRGDAYFNVNLWTGDQAARTITNSGLMQPDFLWTKSRSNAEDHRLSDSVRGGNGTVLGTLASNTTGAEAFDTDVTGFTSTGFNIRAGTNSPNVTGRTYVGWQWQAGRGTTSSNASGTITSTVSVNTTAGFSVVSYTGTGSTATVGHGLGVAPRMIIFKRRSPTANWAVYHASIGNTGALALDLTIATDTNVAYFNNTSPTSSVFTVGTGNSINASTSTYVAYCFAQVAGYSAFGSYTGNGSADGPFVYLGFRPEFVIIKRTDTTETWTTVDAARSPFNKSSIEFLQPNSSGAEFSDSNSEYDLLSNGLKFRDAGNLTNGSGGTYIYMAFAENPFNISRAR